jgi:hypothetical protein
MEFQYFDECKNGVKYICKTCDYYTNKKSSIVKHYKTIKHNETASFSNNNILCCKKCDYETQVKCNFEKHLLTAKHTLKQNVKQNVTESCFCGKSFNNRTSLWRHKKQCITIAEPKHVVTNALDLSTDAILEIVKQNQEFKQLIVEQNQKIVELVSKPTTINNNIKTNNNSHNKKFNLNFFLNEQCKDAMNITDFVSSINLQLTDLENTGKNGFVEGVSQMIIKNLKKLDVYKRPIHCSDAKRETMYVKDQNIWEKEKDEKVKIHKTIRQIAHKNIQQIPKWINEHPKCEDYYSKDNDQYLHIVSESMGGIDDEETNKYYNKIIKNVSKELIIDEEK